MKYEVTKTEDCLFYGECASRCGYGICNLIYQDNPYLDCECKGFGSDTCKLSIEGPVLVCPAGTFKLENDQWHDIHNGVIYLDAQSIEELKGRLYLKVSVNKEGE